STPSECELYDKQHRSTRFDPHPGGGIAPVRPQQIAGIGTGRGTDSSGIQGILQRGGRNPYGQTGKILPRAIQMTKGSALSAEEGLRAFCRGTKCAARQKALMPPPRRSSCKPGSNPPVRSC